MFLDQAAVEAIVPGRHGRVRGEDGMLGHVPQGFVEAEPVVLHPLANGFQRGEYTVPFVQMIHPRRDAQRRQRLHAADAQHQFLANTGAMVAAVQPAGQLAILGAVPFDVAIEQIQVHAADVHQPDLGEQLAGARVDRHGDLLAVLVAGRPHGHVFNFRVDVLFALVAVDVEVLLEIALVVEQADRHQRNAQPAGAFDVVARENPQTTRIDRHRFVDAELGRKIGHRLAAQHPGIRTAPRLRVGHVLLQPAIRVVDAAVQHQLRGPHLQPLGRELGQ